MPDQPNSLLGQSDSGPPAVVYVLVRDNGTIAGVARDQFDAPRSAEGYAVVRYERSPEHRYRAALQAIIERADEPGFSAYGARNVARDALDA